MQRSRFKFAHATAATTLVGIIAFSGILTAWAASGCGPASNPYTQGNCGQDNLGNCAGTGVDTYGTPDCLGGNSDKCSDKGKGTITINHYGCQPMNIFSNVLTCQVTSSDPPKDVTYAYTYGDNCGA